MNTHHIFNKYVAKELGIENAIILQNMLYWIEKNEANETNNHDGKYWTYNSAKAYTEIFPYWNERQISYRLNELEKDGIIESGNFNKKGYDRTKWYTITNYGYSILQNCQMELTKLSNGFNKIVRPIPDVNTDINTNVNTVTKGHSQVEEKLDQIPYKEIIDYLNEKADKNFQYVDSNKRRIKARWNEGHRLKEFKQVIDNKVAEWKGDKKMEKYLRPSTLFGTKFDEYLNDIPAKEEKKVDERAKHFGYVV